MCGIYALFHRGSNSGNDITVDALSKRGPNGIVLTVLQNITMGFTHLRINGYGNQPMSCKKWWVLCNGEIFNHRELETAFGLTPPPYASDCWILPYMFERLGFNDVCQRLDGEFAIIAYNSESNTLYTYRDPYGIRPLFIGTTPNSVIVASEMKAIGNVCTIDWIKPGHCTMIDNEFNVSCSPYHSIVNTKSNVFNEEDHMHIIRTSLTSAVKKRCMSDTPVAALLSGGLDSTIVCAIIASELPQGTRLNTFSIGTADSTDLKYARIASKFLNTNHHEIIVTPADFCNAVRNVIYSIESYDVTTVRASVGNWLVGQYISKHTDFKVIFNGDGADELFGGYLYFHRAPSDAEFEKEIDRLLSEIHMFDVLRSDRSMASHGLEARTPFLDKSFVQLMRRIPTKWLRPSKDRKEKQILRDAFRSYIPHEIYIRQKEAFSDGVNAKDTSWFHSQEDEAVMYKRLFDMYYPKCDILPHMWMPKWCPETMDPSARTLKCYIKDGS